MVLILGAAGHASVVVDAMRLAGMPIAGLLDSTLAAGTIRHGVAVLGAIEDVAAVAERSGCREFFVAMGDNGKRRRFSESIARSVEGASFATVVHPRASVAATATLGCGVIVCAQANVGPNAVIGDGVILNTGSSADHDCVVEAFASLAPGVHLGGCARVGAGSAICIGASVAHGVAIGPATVVGAGAVVVRDLPGSVLAFGVPARVIRPRKPDEQYL